MKTKISLLLLAIVAFIATSCEPINGPKNIPYFSVSPKQKVLFSPGNLQYKASTKEWRFAPRQYDYIGENNIKISDTYSGWIDLFGWGTGHKPTLKSNKHYDYNTSRTVLQEKFLKNSKNCVIFIYFKAILRIL